MATLYHFNVFTEQLLAGNPAAVVYLSEHLSTDVMQKIAFELAQPETVFIFVIPAQPVSLRFFTPFCEVESCIHASLAAAQVLLTNTPQIFANNQCVAMTLNGKCHLFRNQHTTAVGIRATPSHAESIRCPTALVTGLELNDEKIIRCHKTSNPAARLKRFLVEITDVACLLDLSPDFTRLSQASTELGVTGVFVYAKNAKKNNYSGRMFAPAIGIPEDIINGNSCLALASVLMAEGPENTPESFTVAQGMTFNRTGTVFVTYQHLTTHTHINVSGRVKMLYQAQFNLSHFTTSSIRHKQHI
jgi:PhzF family phenazine biosynthesis protein